MTSKFIPLAKPAQALPGRNIPRAHPARIRPMLEMAQGFGKHGVMFIPVPVLCEEDMRALTAMLETNLKKLEEYADEPTKPADNNHAD